MNRREIITVIGRAAAFWPLGAYAQPAHSPVIGLLQATSMPSEWAAAFGQGLAEKGFSEGRNVTIEKRDANGRYDQLPALAAELVRRRVAVIATFAPAAALAAKTSTTTIPIVFVLGSDPVKNGLVASIARPGGNITGVTFFSNLLIAKRLELLHDIVPKAAVVGFLFNPDNPNAALELKVAEGAAQSLRLRLVVAKASAPAAVEDAFTQFVREQVKVLLIAADAYLNVNRGPQIGALALRNAIAACIQGRLGVVSGGLLSYSGSRAEAFRQFGIYVARVLKGEKPADLPVIQPTKFDIIINQKTANALGLTIPPSLLATADEVIE